MSHDAGPDSGHEPAVLRMGSDIIRQFAHWKDPDHAAEEVATHISKFWEPRMRRELLSLVRGGHADIPPLLTSAAAHLVDDDINHEEMQEPSGG